MKRINNKGKLTVTCRITDWTTMVTPRLQPVLPLLRVLSVALRRYLLPQAVKSSGLTLNQVGITDDALQRRIQRYCRESGVRNLQKHIEKVGRRRLTAGFRNIQRRGSGVMDQFNVYIIAGNKPENCTIIVNEFYLKGPQPLVV